MLGFHDKIDKLVRLKTSVKYLINNNTIIEI
jgi:hypothetical protein